MAFSATIASGTCRLLNLRSLNLFSQESMSFDLIYLEPSSGGFHTGHCRIFLDRAIQDSRVRSIHFVVASNFSDYAGGEPEAIAGGCAKVTSEHLADSLVDFLTNDSLSSYRRGITLWMEARRLLHTRPGSICFINFFDPASIGSVFDRKPLPGIITGIIHFPPFQIAMRPALVKNAIRWVLRRIPHYFASYRTMPLVFTFDEYYLKALPQHIRRYWSLVPDPVPLPRELLQSAFSADAVTERRARTRCLLFGSLGHRKGLGKLLDALQYLHPEERERLHIVLAGEIREATTEQRDEFLRRVEAAKKLPGLLIEHFDGYLSEADLIREMRACDVVLAPYTNHIGVSGVVLWSAAAGKPIISQKSGWLGYVVSQANLGLTCDTNSPRALADALLLACRPDFLERFDTDALKRFALGHSADDFYEAIVSRLAELPQRP